MGSAGVECLERRLGVGFERDQASEDVVREVDHRLGRTEVGRQTHTDCADLIGGAKVLRDVGAAEPVDRLFGIADDEQTAGQRTQVAPGVGVGSFGRNLCRIVGVGGEADGDLELDGVGVLELVEQNAHVSLVKQSPNRRMLGDQPASEDQQVVELEQARAGAFGGPIEHESSDDRSEYETAVPLDLFEKLVGESSDLDLVGPQVGEGLLAGGPERCGPLALRSRQDLAFGPVAELVVERFDRFEL